MEKIGEAGWPGERTVYPFGTPHDCRAIVQEDSNLRQVQKQLGHASPATTANMYADITFEDMQNGLNGLYQ